jgi:glycosyltransferase involved in cell wall biosynthesis
LVSDRHRSAQPDRLVGVAVTADRRPHVAIAVVNLPAENDRRVIRECRALEAAGYRVTVICPRGKRRLQNLPGTANTVIRSFPQPFAGSGVLSFAAEFIWSFMCVGWHIAVLVMTRRLVAAQVCNPPDVFFPIALLMRATGRRWIFDHHDVCPELYECKTAEPNGVVLRVLKAFERLSMRCASAVVSTNESYRDIALTRGGCRPDRVTVVRNGPSLQEVRVSPAPHDALADDVRRIVYLGVVNVQDSVDLVVLTAERLAQLRGRGGWEVIIAGDGECLADLRELVAERDLGDIVSFTGWLGPAEVDALLSTATLAIQPDPRTSMAELSTMAKTVEYLARGVPVVAVDLLETRRSAGDAAVYVPTGTPEEFAKAIDALLDDESAQASMRQVALDRFTTELAWEFQAERYITVWQSLVPVPLPTPEPGDTAAEAIPV